MQSTQTMANLEILYQDSDYIAVNKPSGMLVHRTKLASRESVAALQVLRNQIGQMVYPVHRLDRATSGVLIFALSPESTTLLAQDFIEKRVMKKYLAIVRGKAPSSCVIDHPLKEELDKISDKKARLDKPAQEAVTEMETLATVDLPFQVDRYPSSRYSLVKASPRTGRKHQIRRHLRHINCPIIGDVNHGVGKHNRFFREHYQNKRLLLACTEVSFQHPKTGTAINIKAPLAADFKMILEKLGWADYGS